MTSEVVPNLNEKGMKPTVLLQEIHWNHLALLATFSILRPLPSKLLGFTLSPSFNRHGFEKKDQSRLARQAPSTLMELICVITYQNRKIGKMNVLLSKK